MTYAGCLHKLTYEPSGGGGGGSRYHTYKIVVSKYSKTIAGIVQLKTGVGGRLEPTTL